MSALERGPLSASGERPFLALVLLVAATATAWYWFGEVGLMGGLRPAFPLDDSWIHLEFARNLAAGQGLSFEPGELVTGSTAPLWTLLLGVLALLPGSPLGWAKAAGVAFHLTATALTFRLGRELDLGRGLAAFAAVLTALTSWLVWSALSGMEIPLFLTLSLGGMILQIRERRDPARPPLALPVFGLAALARPEGLLLLLLAVADRLSVPRSGPAPEPVPAFAPAALGRPAVKLALGLALAAAALVPMLLFQRTVGGSLFPQTFAAKTSRSLALPESRFLHLVSGILWKPLPWLVLLAPAGVLRLVERWGRGGAPGERSAPGLLPGLWLLGLPVAYGAMAAAQGTNLVGNFGRYFFPLFPLLAVLGVLGLERAAGTLARLGGDGTRKTPTGRALTAAAALVILLPTAMTYARHRAFYLTNLANVEASDVALGNWLAANAPPNAVVAVQDIGAVGYLAPNRVVDLIGLVSPEVIPAVRSSITPDDPRGDRGMLAYLDRTRPDLLAAFTNWRPRITGNRELFRPLARFEVPRNLTMGGDELVLYLTPWSRFTPPPELLGTAGQEGGAAGAPPAPPPALARPPG